MRKETLCWSCQNFAKCSWSRGVPVENWDATPTKYIDKCEGRESRVVESFIVNKCPQYLADKLRRSSTNEIGKLVGLNWRTVVRHFADAKKSKKLLKKLEKQGYKLRVFPHDDYYYLEKIN